MKLNFSIKEERNSRSRMSGNIFMKLLYRVTNDWLRVWKEDFTDGITWDDLQMVKNKIFGEERTAIEIFPPESQLINVRNVRHLWLMPEDYKLPDLKQLIIDHYATYPHSNHISE